MSKTTTKQAIGDAPALNGAMPRIDYDRLVALSSANVEAMIKGSEAVMRGLAQINEELMTFTSSQFKEQVEGTRQIAQCVFPRRPAIGLGLFLHRNIRAISFETRAITRSRIPGS